VIINDNDKISTFQVFVLMASVIIGIGILTAPASIAKDAQNDSILAEIIGGLISIVIFILIYKLIMTEPDITIVEILQRTFGRYVGIGLSFLYVIYFIVFNAFEVRLISDTVKEFLLDITPVEVLIATFILIGAYISRYGIEIVARMCEILMPTMIVIIVVLCFFTIGQVNFSNILPVFTTPPLKILSASTKTFFSYLGFEIFLFMAPYIRRKDKLLKTSIYALLLVMLLYLLILIFCLADFGSKELQRMTWPTLSLFRDVVVFEVILEKPEALITLLWMITTYTTFIIFLNINSLCLTRIINAKENSYLVSIQIPFIFFLSLIPDNIFETLKYQDYFSLYFSSVVVFIIPLITFITIKIKKRKGVKDA